MAFGKEALKKQGELLTKLADNRTNAQAHRTERIMLQCLPETTPTGEAMYLAAVEKTLVGPPILCTGCGEKKVDVMLQRTGTCEACCKKA